MKSVRGPDAHQLLERGGRLAGRRWRSRRAARAAAPWSPACGSRPTAPAVGGTAPRSRARRARSCASADASAGSGPTRVGERDEQLGPVDRLGSLAGRLGAEPEVDDDGAVRRSRGCWRRAATGARGARACIRSTCCHTRSSSRRRSPRAEARPAGAVDVLDREGHRPVGQRGTTTASVGHATSARCAMSSSSASCSTSCSSVIDGQSSFGPRSSAVR